MKLYPIALAFLLFGATDALAQSSTPGGGTGGSGGGLGYDYGVDKPTFALQPLPGGGNKLVVESTARVQVFLQPCRWFDAGLFVTGPFPPGFKAHDIPDFQQCPSGGQTKDLKVEINNPPAGRYEATAWMKEVWWDQWGNKVSGGFVQQTNETTL